MKVIEIHRQLELPPALELVRRAEFYVTLLLERGPGVLQAEPAADEDPVVWRYRSFVTDRGLISHRATTEAQDADRLARDAFRPVLARLAFLLLPDQNPYGGASGPFQVRFAGDAAPRDAFLYAYVANEPTIGTWARLHWYGPQRLSTPQDEGDSGGGGGGREDGKRGGRHR